VNPLRPAVVPPQPAAAGKAAAQLPVPAAPVITTNPSPRLESAAATPDRVEPVVVAPGQIPPAGRQWTAPHLEVSDILGVAGSDGRMAVVNGLPVMEGTRVENALVKEIRDSQVIFEIDGRNIVVPKRAAR
jgi:general secretion pathway protein B